MKTIKREKEKEQKTSWLAETLVRMVKSPGAKVGTFLFVLMCLICILAPVIAPYGVNEMDLNAMFKGPCREHWFGTDAMGRDILTRLLYGGRYSLALGVCASLFGAAIGIVIGSVAGYFGGIVETIIMRIMDVWSSLPSMLLCILISSALGAGFFNTILALTVGGVPGNVRMIRGQILAERSKEYLEAAESINCSRVSIMFKHLLPNVVSPLIVTTTMGIGSTITTSASLSYIGLGVQPPTPEWGAMLSDARAHILNYPYLMTFPGLFIAVTILAINLLGDGLRDALDPKLRN
ncbi:MAG: ABC transporter permease [Eubacteriales bacterium]|nr:ABC transporter permease [Eubacteriales bacterium]